MIHRGRVLLVRRGQAPLKGRWSLPGGLVEAGEELAAALRREIREETGLKVEPLEVIGVFERIVRSRAAAPASSGGRPRYHYVIIDYMCRPQGRNQSGQGARRPRAATDVSEACWARPEELSKYRLTAEARAVILEGFRFLGKAQPVRW